jgi:hypothetical protein
MNYADPRCSSCKGVGGFRTMGGWRSCHCTVPVKTTRDALRRAHETATGHKRLTVDEMIKLGQSGRKVRADGHSSNF